MRRVNLLGIIESLLKTNTTSLEGIIWPKVLIQVEEMRDKVLALEKNIHDLSKINFTPNDSIDSFQENIYFLDEALSNYSITSQEQIDSLVSLLNNMLDYITTNKNHILSLEWVKLNNIKNSFRAIQGIVKSQITLSSDWLTQVITRYTQVYSYIIPKLPTFVNTKIQTDYLNDLSFENFNNENKSVFIIMTQDLRNICQQVLEDTDNFKKLDEWELNELQYSLEKLINVIGSKLFELDNKKYANSDNLTFPKSSLTLMMITINKTKEKVIRSIKRKEIENNIKSQIKTFPDLEKESLMKDFVHYKNFINKIDEIYNFIISNKNVLWEMNKDYIIEIKIFLESIKEKLDYIIEQNKANNTDHLKFLFPANRLSTVIKWLIEKLDLNQPYIQI